MKAVFILAVAAGLSLLATGCSTNQPPIVFLSAPKLPSAAGGTADTVKGLSLLDQQKVEVAVFSRLIKKPRWKNGDYAAICLRAEDVVLVSVQQKFAGHNPPVESTDELDPHSPASPQDRATGLPLMVLSVRVQKKKANGLAEAVGYWNGGASARGREEFILKKAKHNWTIVKAEDANGA